MMEPVPDVTLSEVTPRQIHPEFYKDEYGQNLVRLRAIGTKDFPIKKVTPELMGQFPKEWANYCDGKPFAQRTGTPLTDVPGVNQERANEFVACNVHTAEELEYLHDGQCQKLGHGVITLRRSAQGLLATRRATEVSRRQKQVADEMAKVGAQPTDEAAQADIKELKAEMQQISAAVLALTKLMTPEPKRKPGRPRKDTNAPIEPSGNNAAGG